MFELGGENSGDACGKVPGYTVVKLDTRYVIRNDRDVFARTGPGRKFDGANAVDEQFRGYAVPRAIWTIWIGTRHSWIQAASVAVRDLL